MRFANFCGLNKVFELAYRSKEKVSKEEGKGTMASS